MFCFFQYNPIADIQQFIDTTNLDSMRKHKIFIFGYWLRLFQIDCLKTKNCVKTLVCFLWTNDRLRRLRIESGPKYYNDVIWTS